MAKGGVGVDKIHTLKIDKDCHVDNCLEMEYLRHTVSILSKHHVRFQTIEVTRTRLGRHYYIHIEPPVDANTANRLQYLLGDDMKRASLN